MITHRRITASRHGLSLTITASGTTQVDLTRRTIRGTLYRIGEVGDTSAGPLRVDDINAITVPTDLGTVTMVRDHDETAVRGHLALLDDSAERRYVAIRVVDGPEGDAALAEAADRTRGGLSFGLEDTTVVNGAITAARLVHIGQVPEPAFNSARIDSVAAARTTGNSRATTEGAAPMDDAQIARLAELLAAETRTAEEETELQALLALAGGEAAGSAPDATPPAPAPTTAAAAPAPVTASVPAVPAGVPHRPAQRSATRTQPADALTDMIRRTVAAFRGQATPQAITAALSDITSTAHTDNIEMPAWSGELWSGLQYEPIFTPLFNSGALTNWEGKGWRWVTKPVLGDYAGDKAAIPSATLATESSSYEAARMACGHDFDRKFYDFPNEAFLRAYVEAVREDWAVKLDGKVRAYMVANAVAYGGAAQPTLLKAITKAVRKVKVNTRSKATFVAVADTDMDTLLDVGQFDVPAFLDLLGVSLDNIVSSPDLAAGTVYAGAKQAATVRTLPGSPIRVDAQHIANGGVDTGFFGYWAIEEHHTTGIVKAAFTPDP